MTPPPPADRAASSTVAGVETISATSASLGTMADRDSCGTSRAIASITSAVTEVTSSITSAPQSGSGTGSGGGGPS